MTPIHELLSRLRHDKQFGRGQFEIGYFDRREGGITVSHFTRLDFQSDALLKFWTKASVGGFLPTGFLKVYKDGERIW